MEFQEDIEQCLMTLRSGGVVLYPTDTVWGIGCEALNADAIQKIFEIKHRPENKGMVILLADPREILQYVTQVDPRIFEYLEKAAKPTTVIYEGPVGIPETLLGEDGTVAIRLVKDPFCRQLIKRLRKPLVSTSANLSGGATPQVFSEISPVIIQAVDYAVHYRRGDSIPRQSSAIVRMNRDGTVTTLRS
jgi:L-threonylcarbamoyladenylate synthase